MRFYLLVVSLLLAPCDAAIFRRGGGKVRVCTVAVHTFVDLGDGGCFQFLDLYAADGSFKSEDDGAKYREHYCPYAGGGEDQERRKLFVAWLRDSKRMKRQGMMPFAVNDLVLTCAFAPEKLNARPPAHYPRGKSRQQFCETMASLPLMWDVIGFDGGGLQYEHDHTPMAYSHLGKNYNSYNLEELTKYVKKDALLREEYGDSSVSDFLDLADRLRQTDPANHVTNSFRPRASCLAKAKELGGSDAGAGRRALRAILPSYLLHSYAQSLGGMVSLGASSTLRGVFPDAMSGRKRVRAGIAEAVAKLGDVPELFPIERPDAELKEGLKSQSVPAILRRDKATCIDCERYGHDMGVKKCSCWTAICWMFSKDFEMAFAAL